MPRRHVHAPLGVFLNSRRIGTLHKQTSGAIEFAYDPAWLAWEHALPVSLSLPLRESRYIGAPVVAVFENLLPDSLSIRRRMAERVGAEGTDAFSLLAAVGRDCVGALQFLPDGEEPGAAGGVAGTPVSEAEIAAIMDNLEAAPLGLGRDQDFRISIAGAQEKTALLFWKKRWHKPRGTTPTTHILKPAIGRLPTGIDLSSSVENEFFCLKLMAALGIPAANATIETFGAKRVLVVERFDRRWTADKRLLRLPQEDCCQALGFPPTLRYEADGGPGIVSILNLLSGSDHPQPDQATFLRAQIAFWLLAATDGHAKNFSVFLSPGGRYRLTPAYDVISAQPSADARHIRRNQMKLAMAVGDSRHYVVDTIAPRHFVQSAARAGVGALVVDTLLAEIHPAMQRAIASVLNALPPGFPESVAASIAAGIESRLRVLERAKVT